VALSPHRETLWEWHLRYLITEMRLQTWERPSSWWLPWGCFLQLWDTLTTTHTSRACFKCNQTGHWAKHCPSPHLCHQDPVHNVARMDTGRTTAPLCLCKVG
jgi:hypothetical protein